jgi:hypothetical protein
MLNSYECLLFAENDLQLTAIMTMTNKEVHRTEGKTGFKKLGALNIVSGGPT